MPSSLARTARTAPCAATTSTPWALLFVASLIACASPVHAADDSAAAARAAPKPALSVNVVQARQATLATQLSANGNIAPWQEASVGAQANGWRLAEVRVNVGDTVKRGQVLAVFAADLAQAELAQVRATLAETEATLSEAAANAQRARDLQPTGVISAQQVNQALTAERTARARVDAQRAALRTQELHLRQTQVLAPDQGVISARSATVGAVVPGGQELFRLIRQGRLEWRAEVGSAELGRIKPGQSVSISPPGGAAVRGTVRMLAPTVDPTTRNGLVYVDLPAPGMARAGMYARGEFDLGSSAALTLPQSAVLLRDGFSTVFTVGADSRVRQLKVTTGRREGERIELVSGLPADARVVAAGGAFLADGDLVRVVADAAKPAPAAPAAPTATAAPNAAPAAPAAPATPKRSTP